MKLSLLRVSTVFTVLACGLTLQAKDHDNRNCDNTSLRGEFAFTAQGTTLAAVGLPAALTGPSPAGDLRSLMVPDILR